MARLSEAEREIMQRYAGFYVGMLEPDEYAVACGLFTDGLAARDYSGASGILGVAKFIVTEAGRAALAQEEKGK